MSRLWIAFSRLAALFSRSRRDEELDEELRTHIEMLVEEHIARGMTRADAHRAARRSFGGVDQTKELYRSQRGLPMIETMAQDLRYAVRVLLKHRAFTAVAILALALGIGANTAIFSVVNAVLLRPLPFQDPQRLFALWELNPKKAYGPSGPSMANLADWRSQNRVFEGVAVYFPNLSLDLAGSERPEQVTGALVSTNLFEVLKVKPIRGRAFLPDEEDTGKSQVMIISQTLWERRFSQDPNIIGRTILMDGKNMAIVGVMPAAFRFPGGMGTINKFTPQPADVWMPLALSPEQLADRSSHSALAIARLKPGVSVEQAQAEMNGIQRRIEQQYPAAFVGSEVLFVPLHAQVAGSVRSVLLVLLGAVGFVLLIACVNVANLLLARASSRRKEIALRAALGASRMRLIGQLLTESVLLAATGGALGIALAVVSLNLLTGMLPANFPRAEGISIDLPVLAFALIVSLATGIVFGLAPAVRASRLASADALKDGGRGSTEGFRHNRFRSALVVMEMALSLMLLVGAGLMIRSLLRLQQVNPGFSPAHILTMNLSLPAAAYPNDVDKAAFFQRLIEKTNAIPGVLNASATTLTPMGGNNFGVTATIEGRTYPPGAHPLAEARAVTPQYFDTLRIPLIKGRFLSEQDTSDRPKALVINQKMALKRFPGEDPIGQRLKLGFSNFTGEIVGVAGNVKERGLEDEAAEMVYLNYQQAPYWRDMVLMVRTAGDPLAIAPALRAALAFVDRNRPVSRIRTMESILGDSIAEPRFRTVLLGLFAFTSLVLAMVGIYGVMSYSASRRTHEIGIRMALGASRSDMLKLVVGQGMLLALAGILLGVLGAFGLTRAVSSLLYGIEATDPATFAITAFLLAGTAFLACYIPARKAASVDPVRALRYE